MTTAIELEELATANIIPMEVVERNAVISKTLLPVEKHETPSWFGSSANIDKELAAEFPIIDLVSIMSLLHKERFSGVLAPRFAIYDAFLSNECVMQLRFSTSIVSASGPDAWPKTVIQSYETQVAGDLRRRSQKTFNTSFWTCFALSTLGCVIWAATTSWWIVFAILGGAVVSAVIAAFWSEVPDKTINLKANFSGYIPADVRAKIHRARGMFDSVLLVQEVAQWGVESVRTGDPLIIGVARGVYYLVDRFDTTSFEDYVSKEFTA